MNHIRTWSVVLAVAVLVASGPGATAAPSGTPTSILNVVVADAPPTRAGTRAVAQGVLIQTSGGAGVAGEPVRLEMRAYGSSTFTTVGTVTSDAAGNLRTMTPVLLHNAEFRWVHDGGATYDASTSGSWTELVSTRVRIRVSDRTPRTGQRVVVRGRTDPAKPGRVVSLWRGTKPVLGYGPVTHHTRLVRGHVRADGTYRLVIRFATEGDRRLYVRVAGGAGNVAGFSRYRWVHVH